MNSNKKWWILLSTGIMIVLVNLDMTIVNLALPKMSRAFNASINQTQWIITSYLLATVLFFTIFGRLADIFGRKRIFLLGVALFTLGSLGSACAVSMPWLMVGRFIQGLGFAATLGLSFVIVFSSFPAEQRGFASGLAVGISGFSQAIGPTVGGLIVQYANWPWIFLINVPLGLLSLGMVHRLVPKDMVNDEKKSISLPNIVLFIIGLTAIFYVANQYELLNMGRIVIYLLVGLISIFIFYRHSHKSNNPLINVDLLSNQNFILLSIARCLFMMLFNGILFIVPLYLQNILSFSSEQTGLMLLSMTAVVAITSPITGKVMDKVSFMKPIIIATGLALLAIIASCFIRAGGTLLPLYLSLVLLGIAIGLNIPATIAGVHKMVPSKDAGSAMGLFFTLAIGGAIFGVALAGNLLSYLSASFLMTKMSLSAVPIALARVASGADNMNTLPLSEHALATAAFVYAYHHLMLVLLIVMLIASGLTLLLNKRLTLIDMAHGDEPPMTTFE